MKNRAKLFLTAACILPASTAHAQYDDTAPEIVVTAQKREQNVQQVGVSVTALGHEALAALGRQDVTALATQVPSLQVNQYSPTVTVFNIRGVSQNDFADSQEAPIAFYSDEVYISALGAISGMTFDLERVEVLRGPQGTLFGRNATGGLVQIISAKPTRSLDGFTTGTLGSHGQFATEGAISGPLSENLRARLSFTTNNGGAYIYNRTGPDLGYAKFYAARLQLEGDVGDTGRFRLKAQVLRNDNDRQGGLYSHAAAFPNALGLGEIVAPGANPWGTCNGCDASGYVEPDSDPFTASYNGPNYFDRTYWNLTARYEQDFGAVNFVSITDYQKLKKKYGEDTDMSPASLFEYYTNQNLYQLSQEFRFSGKNDHLYWIAGIYGMKIRSRNVYKADVTGAFGIVEDFGGVLTTESLAAFGQLEYKVAEPISIIAGLRYSHDWKEYDFYHFENNIEDFRFNRSLFPGLANKKFGDWSGKLEFDFKATDHALIYVSVNRGTKSGGFGTPSFGPFDPNGIAFDSEVLVNYEAGIKLTLFDRSTNLNFASFYYDYDNYQSFEVSGVSTIVRNKQAKVKGFEVELNSRPARGLLLQAGATVLDAVVDNVTVPSGDVLDRRMPQAPKFSANALARYEFGFGPGQLALETDWKYNSSQYFSTFNAPVDLQRGYVIGNARMSFLLDNAPVEVSLFVNNVTDKSYLIYNLDVSGPLGVTQQTYGRPRWFGGSLSVRFH